jgi:hypothetical protein
MEQPLKNSIITYLKRHIACFRELALSSNMDKVKILSEAKQELLKHTWGVFVDKTPSVAVGGRGVVIPGCEECLTRINTNDAYLRHLADIVLPRILERSFEIAKETE